MRVHIEAGRRAGQSGHRGHGRLGRRRAPEDLRQDDAPAASGALARSAAPNPFADQTAVMLALAEASPVRIAVYDALGRTVVVLHDGPLAAGERAFRVDGVVLAPGLYVVRAEGAGTGAAVRVVRR